VLGVLKSGPNTTTTTKGFGQTLPHARYSFLRTALSFWKKADTRQGFCVPRDHLTEQIKAQEPPRMTREHKFTESRLV
jgi:hypothetical protein